MKGITQNAGEVLSRLLSERDAPADACVRLSLDQSGQSSLGIDQQNEDDHVFAHEDRSVLVVDPQTYERFNGKLLDFSDNQFQLS